jgi:hypothetical protein
MMMAFGNCDPSKVLIRWKSMLTTADKKFKASKSADAQPNTVPNTDDDASNMDVPSSIPQRPVPLATSTQANAVRARPIPMATSTQADADRTTLPSSLLQEQDEQQFVVDDDDNDKDSQLTVEMQ